MNTQNLTRMGKRRFVKSLAGLGLSTDLVRHITQDDLADLTNDPTEEVPRLQRLTHTNHEAVEAGAPPEREPVFTTIPRDQWVRVESAWDAVQRLQTWIDDNDRLDDFVAGMKKTTMGHHSRHVVEVSYVESRSSVDYQTVLDELPATVAGQAGAGDNAEVVEDIPVRVDRITDVRPTSEYFDYKYRPVPGGCKMDPDGSLSPGTTCTPAYDNDEGKYVMLTAGHNVDFTWGIDVYQPDDGSSSNFIGSSDQNGTSYDNCDNLDWDAAEIELDGVDHKYAIAGDESGSDYDYPIYGIVTWDTVKDWTDCDPEIFHQGKTSGRTKTCVDKARSNKTIQYEDPPSGGDSGGPIFQVYKTIDGFSAHIAGIIACYMCTAFIGGDCADWDGMATYIGKVEDKLNVDV